MSHSELTIRGVSLPIRLGCSADERLNPQPVEIDLTIRFETPPRGMVTDRLEDTVSYEWDFGDGSAPAFGQTISHDYLNSGSYTVTLTVTDDQSDTDIATSVSRWGSRRSMCRCPRTMTMPRNGPTAR